MSQDDLVTIPHTQLIVICYLGVGTVARSRVNAPQTSQPSSPQHLTVKVGAYMVRRLSVTCE
jgi:hypothetical protein